MRTSTEFISSISATTISASFDFHDLVKGRFSDVYRFMSRRICRSLCAFLSRSLINCYTSPSMCDNTWSWCVQGKIPRDLTLLWEIKVNAQVLQRAAIVESLRIRHYLKNFPQHYYLLDNLVIDSNLPNLQCAFYSTWLACTHYKSTSFPSDRDMALLLVYL